MLYKLEQLLEQKLKELLTFKLGLEVYEYISNDRQKNWRDFEAELEVDYPIKGAEVTFDHDTFSQWRNHYDNHKVINDQKDLSSMDITSEMSSEPFRYKEMTLVYLFTTLEDYGNSIVKIVNRTYYDEDILKSGKSWHSGVNKYNLNKKKDLNELFTRPFNINKERVNSQLVELFYELKSKKEFYCT